MAKTGCTLDIYKFRESEVIAGVNITVKMTKHI